MNYTIWVVTPLGYEHSQAFTESAMAMRDGLIELGHESRVTMDPRNVFGRVIVFGVHLLQYVDHTDLWPNTILFNTEQLGSGSGFTGLEYLSLLRKYEVWDYSPMNVEYMTAQGITAKLCGIGYMPNLSCILERSEDIDVLLIGSMNERRQEIINRLVLGGVNACALFNCYGEERNSYIARAKIILNIHYYESKIFEIFRCSYLMANRKCIVSETGLDRDLETKFYDGIAFCEYDGLVDRIKELLADDTERARIARRGFEIFSAKSQAEILRDLV